MLEQAKAEVLPQEAAEGPLSRGILERMRCAGCQKAELSLSEEIRLGGQFADGTVNCRACSAEYHIKDGIFILKIQDESVLREKSQWERFAESEGWLEHQERYLEALPSAGANVLVPKDTIGWLNHEYNYFNMLKALPLKGRIVLDLGAGRCWSSKWMALMGAQVVAFDAMEHPTLGLGAGKVFLRNHGIHFDRVSGDFNQLPFEDGTFDIVFSSGSMHHSNNLERTLAEVARVLRKGGLLSILNEPVSSFRVRDEAVKMEGAQEGINEHEYRMTRYLASFRRLGLGITEVREGMNAYDRTSFYYQGVLGSLINRFRAGRLAYLVAFGGVLNCIARKS